MFKHQLWIRDHDYKYIILFFFLEKKPNNVNRITYSKDIQLSSTLPLVSSSFAALTSTLGTSGLAVGSSWSAPPPATCNSTKIELVR